MNEERAQWIISNILLYREYDPLNPIITQIIQEVKENLTDPVLVKLTSENQQALIWSLTRKF